MIDLIPYWIGDDCFRKTYHLEGERLYHAGIQNGNWLWTIKNRQGWPWDGNWANDQMIFQVFTEQGWTNPKSYKQFISKSFPNNKGGIAWCPRHLDENKHRSETYISTDSSYSIFEDGKFQKTQNLGGIGTVCWVEGPVVMNLGKIGRIEAVIHTYLWGSSLENMERNILARPYGWLQWQLWERQGGGGDYKLKQTSLHDQVKEGGSPALHFPNPLP